MWRDDFEEFELCAVLAAAARVPGLRALSVDARSAVLSHAGLADLISARALEVEQLMFDWREMTPLDVTALAMLLGLRRLSVDLTDSASDDFERLVEHAARGLDIVFEEAAGKGDVFGREAW